MGGGENIGELILVLVPNNPQLVKKGWVFGLEKVFKVVNNNRDGICVDLREGEVLIESIKVNRRVGEAKLTEEVREPEARKAIQVNGEPFLRDFPDVVG